MMSWDVINKTTQEDKTMLKIMDRIRCGMPDSGLELDNLLREYHRFRHDLHEVDGVLCYRDRIVILAALRTKVLIGIHAAHQDISGMTWRIDGTVFRPGINPGIIKTRVWLYDMCSLGAAAAGWLHNVPARITHSR